MLYLDQVDHTPHLIIASFFSPFTIKSNQANSHVENSSDHTKKDLAYNSICKRINDASLNNKKHETVRARLPSTYSYATSNQFCFQNSKETSEAHYRIVPSNLGNIGLQNAVNASKSLPEKTWVGYLGNAIKDMGEDDRADMGNSLKTSFNTIAVDLKDEEFGGHYQHFCKQILWKCFHYQSNDESHMKFSSLDREEAWRYYIKVNEKFALAIEKIYKPGDIIWVNDYHLMLLPLFLRNKLPDAAIGFFLHIPFPSSEIFRCLHVRTQILEGMLSADLVGFQTYSYARHFLMTCTRLLALESTPKGVRLDDHFVSVGIYPIGIDVVALNQKRKTSGVSEIMASMKEKYNGLQIIIARDKSDVVKGVRQKLVAFELFLQEYPDFQGKVVLIQVALTTTEANENESQVTDVVARINSRFGTIEYQPLVYLHQDISFQQYLALLTIADVCLITSLRDGMNLTSHEYIVCQSEKHSPLILSEFAGSYGTFGAALRINPWNKREVADAIHSALTMPEDEKVQRWQDLFLHVDINSAQKFSTNFVNDLVKFHEEEHFNTNSSSLALLQFKAVYDLYDRSEHRLILLDHFGTLLPPLTSAKDTAYEAKMIELLHLLLKDERNIVYILSSRPISELNELAKVKRLGLSAENGAFVRFNDSEDWEMMPSLSLEESWQKQVMEILEYYTDRTPGSYIEQKQTAMVWRYGLADLRFASWQAAEMHNHIESSVAHSFPMHSIIKKNSVEICPSNVHKGVTIEKIMGYHAWPKYNLDLPDRKDAVFCFGDDRMDEYMFEYLECLQSNAVSVMKMQEAANMKECEILMELQGYDASRLSNTNAFKNRSVVTCAIGKKCTAAKNYVAGYLDVGVLLEGFLRGKAREKHPYLLVSTGRTNSALSLRNLV